MHRLLVLLISAAIVVPTALGAGPNRHLQIPIDKGWSLRQLQSDGMAESADTKPPQEGSGWMPAVVPGDVHLDLLRNGRIREPFYRDNESKLQWIEKAGWEYKTTINISNSELARDHIELVFEGLDTACSIYLNGIRVSTPNSMFKEWRIDVKGQLHLGANQLDIVFPAPMAAAEAVAEKDPWHSRTHTDPKGYIRKAVYEFGWDWGPRFATSGVYRPVYLDLWDDARIVDVFAEQQDVSAAVAHLDVQVNILSGRLTKAKVKLNYGLQGTPSHAEQEVTLAPGDNHISFPVEIDHPERWFPAGYGAQPIYHFNVTLEQNGHEIDSRLTKTGLRSVVLRRDRDKWGRSFEFVINGISVFAKGADVIPFDSFPSRVTTAQYRRILDSAKEANMNMIRLWGGGYYETQEFYDLCDELGLMIWHDLMFGNNWQPGTYDFKQNIEEEAVYQMTRLRNHPSIVLWSGNNETEALRDWNGNGQLPAAVHEHIWQDYLTEFSGVLNRAAARIDPQTPYWPSSPSADYEETSDEYQSGDAHDWSVWHGRVDFSEYEKHHWRFTSEYGFQSFPEMKTIKTFTLPEDRISIFTDVMKAHQKNGSGNSLIQEYMHRYYGEPKDFATFLYASQVLQAEAVKTGAEFWRRDRPRSMGSIFWQLNDCWPVASWSSIDYYGHWKALQYYARRFYAPVLVSPHIENGSLVVYAVSDRTMNKKAVLNLRIMRFDGTVELEKTQSFDLPALSSTVLLKVPFSEINDKNGKGLDLSNVFAVATLTTPGEATSQDIAYFVPTKQIRLPKPDIQTELQRSGDGYDLQMKSPVLAKSVFASFGDIDVDFSDDYVDLLPNTPVTIHLKTTATIESLRAKMKLYSLGDAFLPEEPGKEGAK